MKKSLAIVAILSIFSSVNASELKFEFGNPSFSGSGKSTHYLTIENIEKTRKDTIEAQKKADAKANERARKLREKRDKEKVKRITKNMSASKARSVRQAVKKQGGRLATGGRAKGGLMKRSSK